MKRLIPSRRLLVYSFIPWAVGVALAVLALIAPDRQDGLLGQLWLGHDSYTAIKFPGDTIACPEQTYQERSEGLPIIKLRCETLIEGQPLTINVSHQETHYFHGNCAVTYAGRAIPCVSDLEADLYSHPRPIVLLDSDLGIAPARQQVLRWQHPLLYVTESHWWWLLFLYGSLITALEIYFVGRSLGVLRKAKEWSLGQAVVGWGGAFVGGVALWVVIQSIFIHSLITLKFMD